MFYSVGNTGLEDTVPEFWTDREGVRLKLPHMPNPKADSFFIDVSKLQFPEGKFLEGLNVWPGAEWLAEKSVWRTREFTRPDGKPDRAYCFYIWQRRTDQKLVIVDQFGGIKLLEHNGSWSLRTPDPTMVAQYFSQLGLSARYVRAADFALHNLERLSEGFDLNLGNEINQIDAQKRTLR